MAWLALGCFVRCVGYGKIQSVSRTWLTLIVLSPQDCVSRNGSYMKDLSVVEPDLSRVCLVDNSPASYAINQGEWCCAPSLRAGRG